jgi:hypothetical protein
MRMRLILFFITAIASVSLLGCGGSNSSAPNSASNTIVQVSNGSKFNFAHVSIANQDGNSVFTDQFICAPAASDCYVNVAQDINAGYTLLFKDANQRLVSAVVVANSVDGYIALNPNAFSTGFYLMGKLANELASEAQISWDGLNQRTLAFFTNYDSPDGTADPFEEVGDYYYSQLFKGAKSEREFLDAFKLRLLSWDIANNNELPNQASFSAGWYDRFWTLLNKNTFSFVSLAHAQANKCAPALKTFLSLVGNVGKVIPVVGEGVAGAAKLGSSYCDGSGDQLNQIVSQLNDLQNSVDKVASNLGALSAFLFDQAANNKTVEFQKIAQDARALSANYNRFLINNGNVKSLQEYFTKEGGWDRGIQKGGLALTNILNSPYSGVTNKGLYTGIFDTTSFADFNTYLQALKNRCDQLNTSSKDNFIVTRQQCNNIILANSGMLVAAQGIALPIFKDIYTTLNAYQTQAQNTYLLPDGFNSYASAYDDAVQSFANQQSKMIEGYKNAIGSIGFFDAFAGLNTSLVAALTSRQCNQSGTDRSSFPAIIGWYAPTTNAQNNYIETECKVGNISQRVKARYYNGDQGNVNVNDVVNILGVLVAAAYTDRTSDFPVPLYFSTQGMASRTRWENLASSSDATLSVFLEAPRAHAVGIVATPNSIAGGVVSPNLSKNANGFYDLSATNVTRDNFQYRSVYVLVRSKTDYFRVARLNIEFNHLFTLGSSDCIAAPCRTNPSNKEWLIFTEDGDTLDFKPTTRSFGGRKIARLAPVGL